MPGHNQTSRRLIISGATGRMGTRLCAMANESEQFDLIATLHSGADDAAWREAASASPEIVIDFSTDDGANRAATLAGDTGAALLVGTTGLSAQTLANIEFTAQRAPVMIAPNTSLGVAVVKHLAAQTARLLGREYDIDLIDIHHRQKRDAPSGTALRIAETMREVSPEHHLESQRMHSLRSGDVVGEHQIIFSGPGEKISLIHAATSRDVFVSGALRAAVWLVRQSPGSYVIEQSLGLAEST